MKINMFSLFKFSSIIKGKFAVLKYDMMYMLYIQLI